MPRATWASRALGLGAWAHVVATGTYAWAVTVAPLVTARGVSGASRLAAAVPPLILVVWVARARTSGEAERARSVALSAFVLACSVAWALGASAVASWQRDGIEGAAGSLGWFLFALSWASPPEREMGSPSPPPKDTPRLDPRRPLPAGDLALPIVGTVAAACLWTAGWGSMSPERALLVRFVSVAAGLLLVALTGDAIVTRYLRLERASRRPPWWSLLRWRVLLLLGLAACGLLLLGRG